MTPQKIRVAIFPRNLSSLVELQHHYEILHSSARFDPVYIVESNAVAKKIKENGFHAIRLPEVQRQDLGHFKSVSCTRFGSLVIKVLDRFFNPDYLRHNFLIGAIRMGLTMFSLCRMKSHVQQLLEKEEVELLLLSGDRELGWVPPIIKACEKLSIPTIVSLTTMVPADPSSELSQRSHHYKFLAMPGFRTLFWNRFVRVFFSHHLSPDDQGKIFSPGWLIVALELLGMSSSNPWYQGMGRCSAICAEGYRKYRMLLAGGVPEKKLILSGSVMLNELVSKQRKKKRPESILVMVPSYAEQRLCEWITHMRGVRDMVRTACASEAEVTLSLHPKSNIEDYRCLCEEFGCTISDKKFSEEMQRSDLCVCSNSTTTEVATVLSIPVINYDYVNLNIDTWDDYDGVIVENTFENFHAAFLRVTSDPSYYGYLCSRQKEMSEDILFRVNNFEQHFQTILENVVLEFKEY